MRFWDSGEAAMKNEPTIVPNKSGDGVVLASSGVLLRAHLIAKGLLTPAEEVERRPRQHVELERATLFPIEGAKTFKWRELEGQMRVESARSAQRNGERE
jgi:hypothetical protein